MLTNNNIMLLTSDAIEETLSCCKRETQCRINVGSASPTASQHYTDICQYGDIVDKTVN